MQPTLYQDTRETLSAACAAVGDRWSLPVIAALLPGPRRYGEIRDSVPGIAPNVLSARLRTLEQEGLVQAEAYSQRPPRFTYRLTDDGARLADSIEALTAWSEQRAGAGPPRHERCGTALERRWWCPGCETALDAGGREDDSIVL
jgi:DNA-binding HxlR family transcriptional regulator